MPITKTQLERRRNHLGSSDMAAILGLDPYRNAHEVWLEKTDKLEPIAETEAIRAGKMFEPGVLKFAEDELGKLTRNQYRSAKDRGIPLGANIDAIVISSGEPVEAKTAGLVQPLTEFWGTEHTDEVPDRVIIQAHVHMICTDQNVCHVPAFLGGRGFVMFTVLRDQTVAEIITDAAIKFWQNHVLADTPPDNTSTLPQAQTIKRIRREPNTVVDIADELVINWLNAKAQLKIAQQAKEEAEIAMLTALGQAEAGRTSTGLLTYMPQTRKSIDSQALKANAPDVYEKYARTSTYRVARFKENK